MSTDAGRTDAGKRHGRTEQSDHHPSERPRPVARLLPGWTRTGRGPGVRSRGASRCGLLRRWRSHRGRRGGDRSSRPGPPAGRRVWPSGCRCGRSPSPSPSWPRPGCRRPDRPSSSRGASSRHGSTTPTGSASIWWRSPRTTRCAGTCGRRPPGGTGRDRRRRSPYRVVGIDHVQLAMPPGREAEDRAEAFYAGLLGLPRVRQASRAGRPGRVLVRARSGQGPPRRRGGLPSRPQGPSRPGRLRPRPSAGCSTPPVTPPGGPRTCPGGPNGTWTTRSATGSSCIPR